MEGSSVALSKKRPSKFVYVPEVVVSEHPAIVEVEDQEEVICEKVNRDLMAKTVQNYLILGLFSVDQMFETQMSSFYNFQHILGDQRNQL